MNFVENSGHGLKFVANELMVRLVSFVFSFLFIFFYNVHLKFAAKLFQDSHSPPLD